MKARALCVFAFLAGCNGARPDLAKKEAMRQTPCNEYIAAYDHCFDKLSAQSRAIGDRNLLAAKEQMRTGAADPNLQTRCTQAKTLLASACQ